MEITNYRARKAKGTALIEKVDNKFFLVLKHFDNEDGQLYERTRYRITRAELNDYWSGVQTQFNSIKLDKDEVIADIQALGG